MPALKWPLSYLILMSLIALAASLWRSYGASEACEMDGQALSPSLRVDLKMADGVSHAFCTIVCAQSLARPPAEYRSQGGGGPRRHYGRAARCLRGLLRPQQAGDQSGQRQQHPRLSVPDRCHGAHPPVRRPMIADPFEAP